MVEDLQERLEEAKSEIAMKRKDEKDLKSKDRAQMIQISGVCPSVGGRQSVADRYSLKRIYQACSGAWRRPKLITPT